MNPKLKIANAGNVTVPAFLTLQQRGYTVRCERSGDGSQETWIAESATTELLADDIVALLGLASLAESRGPDWKASDDQIAEFLKKFDMTTRPNERGLAFARSRKASQG